MGTFLLVQLVACCAVLALTQGQTGQDIFCARLQTECPPYLVKTPVCASTAVDYETECDFWKDNCNRKRNQRMSLISREPCADDFCPEHCRGEIKDEVCASFFTAQGLYKTKNYRNYCKYREAKCKLRNTQEIELTYSFHGDCRNPPKNMPTTVAATTTLLDKEETVTDKPFIATTGEEDIVPSTDEMIDATVIVTEEALAVTLIDGTPLPETEEYVTMIVYEGETEATVEPSDFKETLPPVEEGTEGPEVEAETEIILVEETEEPLVEGTEATAPIVEEGTQATPVEGTEEPIVETEIISVDETEAPSAEEETEVPLVDETEAPLEEEETQTPPVEEETEALVTEVIELSSTVMPDEVVDEVTSAPEELQETPSPEIPDTSPPETPSTVAPEVEEVPVIVTVLQQCLDQFQNCFNEVPETNDVAQIIDSFVNCMGEFQTCLAENPALGSNGPIESPDIPPS